MDGLVHFRSSKGVVAWEVSLFLRTHVELHLRVCIVQSTARAIPPKDLWKKEIDRTHPKVIGWESPYFSTHSTQPSLRLLLTLLVGYSDPQLEIEKEK